MKPATGLNITFGLLLVAAAYFFFQQKELVEEIRTSGKTAPDPASGYDTPYYEHEKRFYVPGSLVASEHRASSLGSIMAIAAVGIRIAARKAMTLKADS